MTGLEKARELALTSPRRWESALGDVRVRSVEPRRGRGLWVVLDETDFPVDPDGYYFVNPPLRAPAEVDPAAAFQEIVGDAARHYAEHPEVHGATTTTVFSTAADGRHRIQANAYADARERNTGGAGFVESTDTTSAGGGENWQGQNFTTIYFVSEVFLDFDTSSIPDGDTVSSAQLSMCGQFDNSTTDFIIEARLHNWGGTLEAADFVIGSQLSSKTLLATYDTASGITIFAYHDFTSDAAFPANVSKTGVTYIMLSSSRMRTGTAPTGEERCGWFLADEAGTTRDPKLVVNHAGGGGAAVWEMGWVS